MIKTLPAIFLALHLVLPGKTFALTIPETSRTPTPTIIYSPKNSETLIFRGRVQQTADGDGTALYTEQAVYPLLGGDFAMIIGEEVSIIGKMVMEDNIEKIVVARVQFDRE